MNECPICSKSFNGKNIYCSPSCKGKAAIYARYKKPVQDKVFLNCEFCNKAFNVHPCRAQTAKFCSRLCHNRSNGKIISRERIGEKHPLFGKRFRVKPWIILKCAFCKNKFEVEAHKKEAKYCSRKCANEGQIKRGKNSKRIWIKESIILFGENCEKCSSNVKVQVHHIDRNRNNNPIDGSNWMRLCSICHHKIHHEMLKRSPIISRQEFLD